MTCIVALQNGDDYQCQKCQNFTCKADNMDNKCIVKNQPGLSNVNVMKLIIVQKNPDGYQFSVAVNPRNK